MADPVAILYPAVPPTLTSTQRVYTRDVWSEPWVERDELHCQRLTLAARPGMPAAEFRYRFGAGIPMGGAAWIVQGILAVNPRGYVRVVIDPTARVGVDPASQTGYEWIGVWRRARLNTITQDFSATGLERLLDQPCHDVPYERVETGLPVAHWAKRGIPFNEGGRPNRSALPYTINGRQVYVFSGKANATYWSTRTAAELIGTIASPKDAAEESLWDWALDLDALPTWDRVQLSTHGRSFLQILDSLIPRYRLLTWWVDYLTSPPTIRTTTFAENAIELKNVQDVVIGTIPANANQVVLDFGSDQSAGSSLVTEASHVCDRVRVVSNRRLIVCSLAHADDTLVPGWIETEAARYKTGGRDKTGYGDLDPVDQDRANRDARGIDALRDVFARFTLPTDWNQMVGDGAGGDKHPLAIVDPLPVEEDPNGNGNGEPEPEPEEIQFFVYPPHLQFLSRLPLLTGYEYADDVISSKDGQEGHRGNVDGDPPHQELPAMAVIETDDVFHTYQHVERVGSSGDVEPFPLGLWEESRYRRWSGSCRTHEHDPTIEIRVHGEQQHAIAREDFLVHPDFIHGSLDWRDMIVTVCIPDTRHCEAIYPDDPDELVPIGEWLQELLIETSGHLLIDVRPGTVVGVDQDAMTLIRSTGGLLQDDRPQLRIIAQRAYEWHKIPRYALGLTTGWIDGRLKIGGLVKQYTDIGGTVPVRTVVTEVTLDFPVVAGAKEPRPTATYTTAFAEFDPEAIA